MTNTLLLVEREVKGGLCEPEESKVVVGEGMAFGQGGPEKSGVARRLAVEPPEHSLKGLAPGEALSQRVHDAVPLSVGHELSVLGRGEDS